MARYYLNTFVLLNIFPITPIGKLVEIYFLPTDNFQIKSDKVYSARNIDQSSNYAAKELHVVVAQFTQCNKASAVKPMKTYYLNKSPSETYDLIKSHNGKRDY